MQAKKRRLHAAQYEPTPDPPVWVTFIPQIIGVIFAVFAFLFPPYHEGASSISDSIRSQHFGAYSSGFHFIFGSGDHGDVDTKLLLIELAIIIAAVWVGLQFSRKFIASKENLT